MQGVQTPKYRILVLARSCTILGSVVLQATTVEEEWRIAVPERRIFASEGERILKAKSGQRYVQGRVGDIGDPGREHHCAAKERFKVRKLELKALSEYGLLIDSIVYFYWLGKLGWKTATQLKIEAPHHANT